MKTAAAYIRVSTHEQEEYSPESQLRLIRDYAKAHDMHIPDEYVFMDKGISGRSADKRPAFKEMISLSKKKPAPFKMVLVWKFSRFARNQEESIVYKSLLKKESGIDVVSISEPLAEGPFGGLIERIIEWFDEYYSIRLSGEVKRGMAERVRQGGAVSVAPFGYVYKDGQLTIKGEEAETVKMLFRAFLSGRSVLSLVHELNDMGILTRRGKRWENRSVQYILSNPIYIGKIRWSPDGPNDYHRYGRELDGTLLVDGTHPRILDEKTFAAAQIRLAEQTRRYRSSADRIAQRTEATHMLQGLVKCSTCGATLTHTKTGMNCSGYMHGKCDVSHYVSFARIEPLVLAAIEAQLENMTAEIIRRAPVHAVSEAENLERRLQHAKQVLQRCKDAYFAGVDSLEDYARNKKHWEKTIHSITAKMEKEQEENPVDVKTFSETYLPIIRRIRQESLSPIESNQLLRSFVDHIIFDNMTKDVSITYYI